jgi:hypothetical protein
MPLSYIIEDFELQALNFEYVTPGPRLQSFSSSLCVSVFQILNTLRYPDTGERASMRSFSDLTFHSIPDSPAEKWTAPPHARIMLKIFAGQLYFDSNGQYEEVCVLLALSRAHPDAKRIQMDGFVPVDCRTGRFSPFTESKVKILKELMGLRRKGMDYYRTEMGHVLNATPLGEKTYSEMPP